jgi:hypothetical protein
MRPVYATVEIDRVTGAVLVRELHARRVACCTLSQLAEHALHLDALARAHDAQLERQRDRAARRAIGGRF